MHVDSVHASLRDPVLQSVNFLNEVMVRFPSAISFAPGAPHPVFAEDIDLTHYVDRFIAHAADKGLGRDAARRLLFEYGPARGLINDLVAQAVLTDLGIDVPADAVVVTVGAQEAMFLTLRALCTAGRDQLAVVNPTFVGIVGASRLLDLDVIAVPECDDGIDVAQLATACAAARRSGRRVRACYVAPDFANPSGTRMSLSNRRALLDLAGREGLVLIEDNVYGFTALPGMELPSLKAMDGAGHVVHIGSFAKVCFPGARVGFVIADQTVGPPDAKRLLAADLAAIKSMVTVNTAPLCQAAIGGMLLEHGGSLRELSRPKAELYQRNLRLLLAELDRQRDIGLPGGVTWNRPDGGFFVRVQLPIAADADLLTRSADAHGVLWTPMSQFYLDGTGDNVLRLSCSYLSPDEITTGIGRFAEFLRKEIPA